MHAFYASPFTRPRDLEPRRCKVRGVRLAHMHAVSRTTGTAFGHAYAGLDRHEAIRGGCRCDSCGFETGFECEKKS